MIEQQETQVLAAAAQHLKNSIIQGGILHSFGSGHSALVAADIVGRSGCLVPVNQIIDKSEDMAERLNGYGYTLMKHYEQQYQLRSQDSLIVISNSGRNPLPVEVALAGRDHGLNVIGICNVEQAKRLAAKHETGKKLLDVCDLMIDTHAGFGETALELAGHAVGPVSSFAGMFIVQSLMLLTLEALQAEDHELPIFVTENAGYDNADERNAALRNRYVGRLRRAGA